MDVPCLRGEVLHGCKHALGSTRAILHTTCCSLAKLITVYTACGGVYNYLWGLVLTVYLSSQECVGGERRGGGVY